MFLTERCLKLAPQLWVTRKLAKNLWSIMNICYNMYKIGIDNLKY